MNVGSSAALSPPSDEAPPLLSLSVSEGEEGDDEPRDQDEKVKPLSVALIIIDLSGV